ncbi:MAG: glucose dehydrogenase, partial [bacterium]
LENASNREKQAAFATLEAMNDSRADSLLAEWMKRLTDDKVPAAVRLDLLEAASQRAKAEITTLAPLVEKYLSAKSPSDPLAAWLECLEGGRPEEGRSVVLNSTAGACLRCHIVRDKGGNVGPELNGIGKRYDRRTILESIVAPNAKIAEGFQSVVLGLKDGTVVAGVLRKETPEEVLVMTAEAKLVAVPAKDIEERAKGISAMPADLATKLSKKEIRDVVEFLSRLREKE